MVQRMAGPERISATALSTEVGVSQATLSRWLRDARTVGPMNGKNKKDARKPRRRTAVDKFRLVTEAASLSGEALGEFLRKEGVHAAELEEWRKQATDSLKDLKRRKSERTPEARRIRELESELRRKEKALAEAAALLVLQKKLQTYWEEKEGGTNTRNET
jgi:transposase-like protein